MMLLLILASHLKNRAILDNVWVVSLSSLEEADVPVHRERVLATTASGTLSPPARIVSTTCARSFTTLVEQDSAENATTTGAPVATCAGRRLLDFVSIAGSLCAARIKTKTISAAVTACLR